MKETRKEKKSILRRKKASCQKEFFRSSQKWIKVDGRILYKLDIVVLTSNLSIRRKRKGHS